MNYYNENCDFLFNQTQTLTNIDTNDWLLPSILCHNHETYIDEQIENGTDSFESTNNRNTEDWFQVKELLSNLKVRNLISQSIGDELKQSKEFLESLNSARNIKNKSNLSQSQIDNKWQREILYKKDDEMTATMIGEDGKIQIINDKGTVKSGMAGLSEEEQELARQKELNEMERKLNGLKDRVSKMKAELLKMEENEKEKENEINNAKNEQEKLSNEKKTKEKTLKLLPNAEENLKKLGEIVARSKRKLENAHIAWDKEELKYVNSLENEKELIESRQLSVQEMKNEIKLIRQQMRQCASDIRFDIFFFCFFFFCFGLCCVYVLFAMTFCFDVACLSVPIYACFCYILCFILFMFCYECFFIATIIF